VGGVYSRLVWGLLAGGYSTVTSGRALGFIFNSPKFDYFSYGTVDR